MDTRERTLHRRVTALNRLLRASRATHKAVDEQAGQYTLFVVLGSLIRAERSLLQHRTWCRNVRCFFVTDDWQNVSGRYDTGMRLVDLGSYPSGRTAESCCTESSFFCSSPRRRTFSAQFRFLPALLWAQSQMRASWALRFVALVDDDSFVLRTYLPSNGCLTTDV